LHADSISLSHCFMFVCSRVPSPVVMDIGHQIDP
jgi:hypothetical protein